MMINSSGQDYDKNMIRRLVHRVGVGVKREAPLRDEDSDDDRALLRLYNCCHCHGKDD